MTENLENLMRVALDKHAREAGVQDPESLPTKQAVVDAINALSTALVHEPPAREPQTYKVIGPHLVNGTPKGKTFVHLFTPEQEAALIQGGHIITIKEKV